VKPFFKKSIAFWFVLLILAFINASVRETTYKPLLTPYIGMWSHQISSLTGIILFYWAIYLFLKRMKSPYSKGDLFRVGIIWILMTFVFECFMNVCIRHLSFEQVLKTYYFWKGDTWIFVLLSLLVLPHIAHKKLGRK
jgi:hypothetical protein